MSSTLGATRNRTDLFLKYRKQARGSAQPLHIGESGPDDG